MLDHIYNLFNEKFKDIGTCYLAGGCVRDDLLKKKPKDYDFFILTKTPIDGLRELIQHRLKEYQVVSPLKWHNSEPFLIVTVKVYDDVEVQVLVNPAKDIEELLDNFDWNVCRFAYGMTVAQEVGHITKTFLNEIEEGQELKLHKSTFPLSSLRRGFRFSERFKMQLRKEDLKLLCEQVLANMNKNLDKGPMGNVPDLDSLGNNFLVK